MTLHISPITPALGAQISSVDLSQELTGEQRDAIEQALLDYQVLFFRNQPLTPRQHADFAARFGELHIHPIYPNVPEQPEVLILDTAVTDVRDNAVWHTDVTFLPTPALGAVLSARQLPEIRRRHLVGQRHRGLRSVVQTTADAVAGFDCDP